MCCFKVFEASGLAICIEVDDLLPVPDNMYVCR